LSLARWNTRAPQRCLESSATGVRAFGSVASLSICVALGFPTVAFGGIALVDAVVLPGAAEILTQSRETCEQLGQRRFGGVGRALWIRGVG
jgi:hypothetical protein